MKEYFKEKQNITLIVIAVIFLFSFILTFNLQSLQKTDAAIVDASGRNRMLSQRIALLSHQLVHSNMNPNEKIVLDNLRETIDLHHESFYALKDGGIAPGISNEIELPVLPPEVLPLMLESENLWMNYKMNAEVIFKENEKITMKDELQVIEALKFLEDNSNEMLTLNNDVVKVLVELSEKRNFEIKRILLILIISGILLIIYASISSKRLAESKLIIENYSKKLQKQVLQKTKQLSKSNDELKQRTKKIEKMYYYLKKSEQANKKIFMNTTHELKTPLVPILMNSEIMQEEGVGTFTNKQKGSLKIITKNIGRLEKLINDLLEISRIEAMEKKLIFSDVNIRKEIEEELINFKNLVDKKKIKLINSIPKLNLSCDIHKIKKIIRNLISNALKFTTEGEIVINLVKKKNKEVIISVKDTGVGMSKRHQEKVFLPFYQIKPSYEVNQTGTGLGLTICKKLVEQMNGKIWIESKGKNKGTTFYFSIPFHKK